MLNKVFFTIQGRCLSTSSVYYAEGRMLKKMLTGNQKQNRRKFIYQERPVLSSASSLGSITGDGKKATNSKRINVLNKLFMKHITDLMSTGTYSHEFTGHGIEINRVKVAPDFKHVKVFWLARSDKLVENIEDTLKSHASALRQELTGLHVIGIVPKIEFVKDNHYTMLKLLDDKLIEADYGDDHEVIDSASRLKRELELQTTLESSVRQKIEKLEQIQTLQDTNTAVDFDIPTMPQNVLGLDHANIMQRLRKNLQKSQGLLQQVEENSIKTDLQPCEVNCSPVSYPSMRLQREAFREFLNKRIAMKHKMLKADKAMEMRPELDYLDDEWWKKRENDLECYDFHEFLANEKDYIEDVNIDNNEGKHLK